MFCTGDFHDQQSKEIIGGISESKEERLFSGVALSSSPSLSLVLLAVLCRRKAEGSACIDAQIAVPLESGACKASRQQEPQDKSCWPVHFLRLPNISSIRW
jgi:hypothetical protein